MSKKKKDKKELLEEAVVPEEEQRFKIPSNWVWTWTGIISDVIGGGTPKSTVNEFYDGGTIPWLTPVDLSGYTDMYISSGRRNITEAGLLKSSARLLPPNTVLMSSRAPIGYVAIASKELSTNQGFKSFTPSSAYYAEYLYWYLKFSRSFLESMGSGSTFKELSGTRCKEIPVPLPPMNEQKRIADKLESLLSKIDGAKQLIEEAKETFELRRAAILDKAFRGKLTKHWRELNKHVEDAGMLYRKIKEAQSGKIKPTKAINDDELIYTLPSNWKWVRLGDIFKITSGGTPKRTVSEYYDGNIPWVKTGEIKWNYIYDSEENITPVAVASSSAKLLPRNTVLVAMYGQGLTRGRAAILAAEATCNQAVCALLPNEYVLPEFLYYYFMEGYRRFRQVAKGGNQENLSATMISEFLFPLPPLEEQVEIIKLLQKILGKENNVLELIGQQMHIEKLKESILFKAFRGELGTNDPSETSAIELLKEIVQEQVK